MDQRTSCGLLMSTVWFSLYQEYLAAGLASLLQVRVTVLPTMKSVEGFTDTEGSLGASGGEINKHYLKVRILL